MGVARVGVARERVRVLSHWLSLSSSRGRKVICAYSIEDIDQAFSTSKLRGYSSPFIGSRPGTVRNHLSCFRNQSETQVCVRGRRDLVCVHPLPSLNSASAKTRPRWVRTT